MADCNPLQAAPVSIGSHPYGETKELLLDVFAAQNIWQTCALHVGVFGVGVVKVEDWSRKWLNFNVTGSLWLAVWIDQESD